MKRETFTDQETGREIETSWLAKTVGQNFTICVIVTASLAVASLSILACLLFPMLIVVAAIASIVGVILSLAVIICIMEDYSDKWDKKAHDAVARWQDRRREARRQRRIIRRRLEAEWAGVPDGALSRAQPPGEPQPTAASLSRAETPEENLPRLAAGVEEEEINEMIRRAIRLVDGPGYSHHVPN